MTDHPSHASWDEPHVPAEPDSDIASILERVGRAITGDHERHNDRGECGDRDGRELTSDELPCPGADETS